MQDALRQGWCNQHEFTRYTRSEDRTEKERAVARLLARLMRTIMEHEQKASELKPILDRMAQNMG